VKIRYPTTAEADAAAIRCTLPVDEEDVEALREAFPRWRDDVLTDDGRGLVRTLVLTLDLETRAVRGWEFGAGKLFLKVRDEGVYELLDQTGAVLGTRDDGYVPACVPNYGDSGGDYFIAQVEGDGTVKGWRPHPRDVVATFWGER
jgi:hypothetical protein